MEHDVQKYYIIHMSITNVKTQAIDRKDIAKELVRQLEIVTIRDPTLTVYVRYAVFVTYMKRLGQNSHAAPREYNR